jgi:hypothetical protein
MDKEQLLKLGIAKRNGEEDASWDELNISCGCPFKNGENFRCFIKKQLKKNNQLPVRPEYDNQEYVAKKIEIDTKIQEFRDERTYLNKVKRPVSRTDNMLNVIKEVTTALPYQQPYSYIIPNKRKRQMVILHSDGQVGEMIRNEDTGGFNQYNFDIYKNRQEKYMNEILSDCHELGIDEATVCWLGDAVEGNGSIYKKQKFYLESHVVKQIFQVSESNGWFLNGLHAAGIKNINSMAVSGNHGIDGYDNHAQANFDILAYDRTKLLLGNNPHINFQYSNFFMTTVNVLGYSFLLIHGDGMDKKSLDNAFYKYAYMYADRGIQLYTMLAGHFHVPMTLDVISTAGSIIVNGNIVGTNDLALHKLHSDNQPSQTYFVVEEDKGITYQRKVVLN